MFKLVLHISDIERWQMALNNVNNAIASLKENNAAFEIAVIANAGAVKGYLDASIREQIHLLAHNNLQFFACNNSLKGQNISQEILNNADYPSSIDITPAAIIALVEYQQAGFSYVKP